MTVSQTNTCQTQSGRPGTSLERYERWMQTMERGVYSAAGLSNAIYRKAPPDMSALKPYWGKPTVRFLESPIGDQ